MSANVENKYTVLMDLLKIVEIAKLQTKKINTVIIVRYGELLFLDHYDIDT